MKYEARDLKTLILMDRWSFCPFLLKYRTKELLYTGPNWQMVFTIYRSSHNIIRYIKIRNYFIGHLSTITTYQKRHDNLSFKKSNLNLFVNTTCLKNVTFYRLSCMAFKTDRLDRVKWSKIQTKQSLSLT